MLRYVPRGMILSLILSISSFLTGCGSSSSAHSDSLRIPVYGGSTTHDPALFDPARASTGTPDFLSGLMHVGLVKFGPDLHVIPELAVSIPTISNNGRAYTFTIRQDARFADGRRATARDVDASFTRALSPAVHSSVARQYLGGIVGAAAVESGKTSHLRGVQVLHRLTVRIRLSHPDATFLQKLAFPVASVVETGVSSVHPPGLGPWVVGAVDKDGGMTLVPRPHFYDGPLELTSLKLIPVAGAMRGLELYRKGQLDVAKVPATQVARYDGRAEYHDSDGLTAYYAVPRGSDGRALAARLDRDALMSDSALRPWSQSLSALTSVVPPALPDYVASTPSVDGSSSQAGTEKPPPVRVDAESKDDPLESALAAALSGQWKSGPKGSSEVRLVRRSFALPDPGRWLLLPLPSSTKPWVKRRFAGANALTNDPVTRMSDYSDIEDWALRHGIIIPLVSTRVGYLIRPSVGSLQVTPVGPMPQNNNWSLVSVG